MRYDKDVLTPGWQRADKPVTVETPAAIGMVVEDPTSGFCGSVVRWENGLIVLEDRKGRRRSFPFGPGILAGRQAGEPGAAPSGRGRPPPPTPRPARASARSQPAKVAAASRIYVEGRHDAELVEKIWGDDLRHVGVVVEYLGGIDDLPAIVAEFAPGPGRRLGVLVDHLVRRQQGVPHRQRPRLRQRPGHRASVHRHLAGGEARTRRPGGLAGRPARASTGSTASASPSGGPANTQADIAATWQWILGRVRDWNDLDPALPREVERLIDFVTEA